MVVMIKCMDLYIARLLRKSSESRYMFRQKRNRKGPSARRYQVDLDDDWQAQEGSASLVQPWLNESEFLQKYQCSRESFDFILQKIKDDPVFHGSNTRKQASVEAQLMTCLHFVRTEGSGESNANQRNTFGIGYCTAAIYRDRVTIAIRKLAPEYFTWPDEAEREKISMEIYKEYDFPHCVYIVDGTLFPPVFEPETEDAPDYSGRKYGYSITALIFNDH